MDPCTQEHRITAIEMKLEALETLVIPIQKDIRAIKYIALVALGICIGIAVVFALMAKDYGLILKIITTAGKVAL